jgi:hypothetical protein
MIQTVPTALYGITFNLNELKSVVTKSGEPMALVFYVTIRPHIPII